MYKCNHWSPLWCHKLDIFTNGIHVYESQWNIDHLLYTTTMKTFCYILLKTKIWVIIVKPCIEDNNNKNIELIITVERTEQYENEKLLPLGKIFFSYWWARFVFRLKCDFLHLQSNLLLEYASLISVILGQVEGRHGSAWTLPVAMTATVSLMIIFIDTQDCRYVICMKFKILRFLFIKESFWIDKTSNYLKKIPWHITESCSRQNNNNA